MLVIERSPDEKPTKGSNCQREKTKRWLSIRGLFWREKKSRFILLESGAEWKVEKGIKPESKSKSSSKTEFIAFDNSYNYRLTDVPFRSLRSPRYSFERGCLELKEVIDTLSWMEYCLNWPTLLLEVLSSKLFTKWQISLIKVTLFYCLEMRPTRS